MPTRVEVPDVMVGDVTNSHGLDPYMFVDDTDPMLSTGDVDAPLLSPFSSSSDCHASSDEDTLDEVQQTKRAKKKVKVKVHPIPPGLPFQMRSLCSVFGGSVVSQRRSLLALVSIAPFPHALSSGTWRLPCSDQPQGIRHLLGIYVLSRECGVVISTEHLSYLTDFRVCGRSEELKHTLTNSFGMALIAGFPSKDDHFEDRFFFVEFSERTVEADCIELVKTRWEGRVKPSLPEVLKEFVTAMHTELSSGNGNWRKSFSRRRIERALSAEIFPGKILGRGQARVSFRDHGALEAASKAKGSSGTNTPRVVAPTTSTPTAPSMRARSSRPLAPKTLPPPPSSGELAEFRRLSAERARISSSKGKGIDRVTPSKRQRVDTHPAAVVGRETSASHVASSFVGGLLRDEAYSAVKSKTSERFPFFYRLVIMMRMFALGIASLVRPRSSLTILQSRLDEYAEQSERSRIDDAVAEAKDEMACGFAERASEGSEPPDLPTEVKAVRERRNPIYDAQDAFADLLASVRRVLEIPVVSAGTAEASVAVDDDVEVTDKDDVEVIDDEEDAED
ncbi:hypothetical protein AALP_AA4G073400 [Arabis alpina]|uniref:Uncharacterized protein n=2 Tax=Arabis alpina TaxID=50452 RepID=A0A087H1R5_ARAAL|nr:hypothetical protein AALP_AA4G073400 [Arabis alpina]